MDADANALAATPGIVRLAEYLELNGFEHHPEKTRTGRLEVWFGPDGVTPSPRALQNQHDRCLRLFEQVRKNEVLHCGI